jgi:hypothetical protein
LVLFTIRQARGFPLAFGEHGFEAIGLGARMLVTAVTRRYQDY